MFAPAVPLHQPWRTSAGGPAAWVRRGSQLTSWGVQYTIKGLGVIIMPIIIATVTTHYWGHAPCRMQWTSSCRERQVSLPHRCPGLDNDQKGPWQWALGDLKGQDRVPVTVTLNWHNLTLPLLPFARAHCHPS